MGSNDGSLSEYNCPAGMLLTGLRVTMGNPIVNGYVYTQFYNVKNIRYLCDTVSGGRDAGIHLHCFHACS
jgi:hypothetical protein